MLARSFGLPIQNGRTPRESIFLQRILAKTEVFFLHNCIPVFSSHLKRCRQHLWPDGPITCQDLLAQRELSSMRRPLCCADIIKLPETFNLRRLIRNVQEGGGFELDYIPMQLGSSGRSKQAIDYRSARFEEQRGSCYRLCRCLNT